MVNAAWMESRQIARRIFIKANLELLTPTHFGGGEDDNMVDMSLALDPMENKPLLTGTALAGALRNYLRARKYGYSSDGLEVDSLPLHYEVFGWQGEDEGNESWLVLSDSVSQDDGTEIRDNVAINPASGTAESGQKFDYELLEAGIQFPLRIELLLPSDIDLAARLLSGTAIALQGLERAEIPLGAKKKRGFGKCKVNRWEVFDFDLSTQRGLDGWLSWNWDTPPSEPAPGTGIEDMLNVSVSSIDARKLCKVTASLRLTAPLLIRSATGDPNAPDLVHLQSRRDGVMAPILSGTSAAGTLREHCQKIVNTLNASKTEAFLDKLWGKVEGEDSRASRIAVGESTINNYYDKWVQSRLKIDRFTGGAYPAALFDEMPVFPMEDGEIILELALEEPEDAEIGLLLLLLRDLALEDLAFGGGSGVGRGRVKARHIRIEIPGLDWEIDQDENERLIFSGSGEPEQLENKFVAAFREAMR